MKLLILITLLISTTSMATANTQVYCKRDLSTGYLQVTDLSELWITLNESGPLNEQKTASISFGDFKVNEAAISFEGSYHEEKNRDQKSYTIYKGKTDLPNAKSGTVWIAKDFSKVSIPIEPAGTQHGPKYFNFACVEIIHP